jgi:rod shape-determining protein MreC
MDQIFSRYRTISLLGLLLVGQLLLLAWQVRRPDAGGVRLLRVWSIQAVVPVEKASQWVVGGVRSFLSSYVALHEAEQQNQDLKRQVGQLRLQNDELEEQVRSMPRLAELLAFQENYINRTMEADVIGSGASANAQVIYLNRGEQDGVRRNMAVISPDGVVGKITQVFHGTSEVLLLTDPDSGVGAMMQTSRLHGILQGLGDGRAELRLIVNDQQVKPGEHVLTSGEDQVYPKGLPLGTVISVRPGSMFQHIVVQPAVSLARLEEVLIVTGQGKTTMPESAQPDTLTAAQIRQKQLPTIPDVTVVPRTGPPPPMAQILEERRQAAIAAAKAANAAQQGVVPPVTQTGTPRGTSAGTVSPMPGVAKPMGATAGGSHPVVVKPSPVKPGASTAPEAIPPGEN